MFYPWGKFLGAGKTTMANKSNTAAAKALRKENDRLKMLLAESTLVVDA